MNIRIPALALFAIAATLPTALRGQARIVGGTKAPEDTYQWIAALADAGSASLFQRQFCGATLIAPDWVLTAAHCVDDTTAPRLQVVVGLTDLNDTSGAEIRGVKGIYIHPNYSESSRGDLFSDIALLLLDSPITTIDPISFAPAPFNAPAGTLLRALGWGDTQASPRYPTELQMVDLNLVSLSSANRHYGGNLDRRHLAAMTAGKDTCSGDSGGPLFDEDGGPGGVPLLVGLTSYGIRCASSYPGIYANVGNFAGWIHTFRAQPTVGAPTLQVKGNSTILRNNAKANRKAGSDFGRALRPKRTAVRKFTIVNPGGGIPLSIYKTKSANRHFQILAAPNYVLSGGTATLRVRFRAPSTARNGKKKGRVTITSNAPGPVHRINLSARYKKDKKRTGGF